MATITNYCVIDHIGQVEDVKAIYNLAYKHANLDGFDNNDQHRIWKMKEIIQTMSNNRAKDKATKWAARHTKNPKIVYLICNSIESNKYEIKNAIDSWGERDIPVAIISEQDGYIPPETPPTYDFGLEVSRYRECALIWSTALGWSFSAPLVINHTRETFTKTADPYTRRDNNESGSYAAKRFSSDKAFEKFHTVASEEECKAFFDHYKWLWMNGMLAESLECDYELDDETGRPVRVSLEDTFYDDSYNEENEDDDATGYDSIHYGAFDEEKEFIKSVEKETNCFDFAVKNYKAKLADIQVMSNQAWF